MAGCFSCDPVRVMHVCVLSVFSFAALVFVVLRLFARKIQMIRWELNDYLCIAGLVCPRLCKGQFDADGTQGLYIRINGLHNA